MDLLSACAQRYSSFVQELSLDMERSWAKTWAAKLWFPEQNIQEGPLAAGTRGWLLGEEPVNQFHQLTEAAFEVQAFWRNGHSWYLKQQPGF